MREDDVVKRALCDADLESVLVRNIPEVRLWVHLEDIDAKYAGGGIPDAEDLRLYGCCLDELRRRGAKPDRYQHNYKMYCGARKCARL